MPDALKLYKSKRDFSITSEPAEGGAPSQGALTFVIQKHWATRLHYDFRLELDGTMKSWAVPKGPSFDTHDKRMAVHVEDHPISYSDFEGTIPPHQYGAGKVIVWDKGTWTPLGDPREGYAKGEIKFEIHGHKMHGRWVLVRMKNRGERQESWLLIKENDEYARPAGEFSVVDAMPDSVHDMPMPDGPGQSAAQARVDALDAEAPASARARKPAAKSVAKSAAKAGAKSAAKPGAKAGVKVAANVAEPAAKAGRGRGAMPAGAVKAALPETLSAELATLVDGPPPDPENWIYEIKFDGYRMLARVADKGKDVRLITRNGKDWTGKLGALQKEIRRMKLPDGWYDGEIVVHDENGKPNFNLLQLAFDGSDSAQIVYFVFDIPYFKGHDLREVRLDERRPLLQDALAAKPSDTVRFSAEFGTDPAQLVVAACQLGLEGVIGKRRDSRYVTRRSPEWIKLKCGMRQEFVIGGWTDPQGARTGIGSLLLGYYDEAGVLRYAGHVGSGFNGASLRHLREVLETIGSDDNPFPPRAVPSGRRHWVRPELVAEVSFSEWTPAGVIRHPVFQGLRKDKPARAVVRERARHVQHGAGPADDGGKDAAPAAPAKRASKARAAGQRAAEPVAAPASKNTAKTAAKAAANTAANTATKNVAKTAATNSASKARAVGEPAAETVAAAASKSNANSAAKSAAKAATKAAANTAANTATKNVAKTAATSSASKARGAGQPAAEPVAAPASKSTAKSAAKTATKAVAKTAATKSAGKAKAASAAPQLPGNLPPTFKVTHGERIMDAQSGVTKIELVRYYALVGELMMAHLKDRPVSLVRAPEGVGGELFFQKHVLDPAKMPGVALMDAKLDPAHPRMTTIATEEGLLSAAQWNVIEIHSQNATGAHYETPDRMVFDLDPGEGVGWPMVQEAALLVRAFLGDLGLNAFVKTSGGKGLHVVVPIKPKLDWDTVKDFAHAIVNHLAKTLPDRFSAKAGAKNRVGRIFIDYLRNGRGATTVAAWSARTRPGLGISVPVRWDELPQLTSGAHWTVQTVHTRLDEGNAPWADYAERATGLGKAMKTLGFKPAKKA